MTTSATILVVDDDPRNLRLMESILKSSGYPVLSARDGEEALGTLARERVDAVLLDVMMPGMSGFEVCGRIRGRYETRLLPVIMVTALNSLEEKVQALEIGADDFLSKPVNRVELLAKLRTILRAKALHDEVEQTRLQLEQKNRELLRLEQMREKLTQMVVHDLKNPLTGIVGNLQLLEIQGPGMPPESFRQILTRTQESARQLMSLILTLLDVARMEEEKLTLKRQRLRPEDLIRSCLRQAEGLARKAGVDLLASLPDVLPEVEADPDLAARVLGNLLSNALKHTPTGGKVELGAAAEGEGVRFWVRDTGEGIPLQLLPRVFDKFVVGEPSTNEAGMARGTGLGLTFCKLAVEAHGGRIWVESHPGAGSRFFFTLPGSAAPAGKAASPEEAR